MPAIPSLRTHTCSFESEGGFVRRLQEDGGTWLGHVLEHVAIELQQLTASGAETTVQRLTTNSGGGWRTTLTPRRTVRVRALHGAAPAAVSDSPLLVVR